MLRAIRRILRILLTVVVLSALVIIALQVINVASVNNAPETVDEIIDETVIEPGDLAVTVSGTGAIAPAQQVALVFELASPVTEVLVQAGDVVQQGDVLARLDSTDFQAALDDAQLALDSAQLAYDALTAPPREVDLAVAEAALVAAQSSYNAASATAPTDAQLEISRLQTELARNQFWQSQLQRDGAGILDASLIPPDVLPPEIEQALIDAINGINAQNTASASGALESLEYGVQIADARYASTQSQGPDYGAVNSAYAGIVQAGITLDRVRNGAPIPDIQQAQFDLDSAGLTLEQAQQAVGKTLLLAPFDGVIAENNLVVGQLPPTQQIAVLLMDTSRYQIDIPIDETDIVSVVVGQSVTLALDALPDVEITGTVTRVSVTPTTIGQLVTYLARVELDPTTEPIRVAMTTTARITTQQLTDTLLIRNRFVRIDRETQQAYITIEPSSGVYEEIPVVLGLRNDTFSQIVSGATAGQKVVLLPRSSFIPGVQQ
ncbi:MAG: HlyD family efflux transporter periplasmic adaptor subunit [Armatimonadetes bacterium]|nr:HlyD family efflux transporter periplasmic adaptor subunit [Anaerolineae bacterium]